MISQRTMMLTAGCGFGLGAGLMYLLDPDRGSRRRALLRDKTLHLAREARVTLEKRGRDLGNRVRGLASETASRFRCEEVADEVLTERVRSKMGRVVSDPGDIEVLANAGQVTLRGIVFAHEAARLLQCVSQVRGVCGVESQLKVRQRHGETPLAADENGHEHRAHTAAGRLTPRRLLATFAGSGLALYGARRRGLFGSAVSLVGVRMLRRGLLRPHDGAGDNGHAGSRA